MPFVVQSDRIRLDNNGDILTPGDLCYLIYKKLVRAWKNERRWTTVHNLYKNSKIEYMNEWWFKWQYKTSLTYEDFISALDLAWQVFFNLHVMEYEKRKQEENGDI